MNREPENRHPDSGESGAGGNPRRDATATGNGLILGMVAVSLVLKCVPWLRHVLLPFVYFTTFIHEGCHAVAAWLMGQQVRAIVIHPDTSGYMTHTVTGGVLANVIIGNAGYVGAALCGGALIVLSAYEKLSKILMVWIGILFFAAMVICMRDAFTLILSGMLASALLLTSWKGGRQANFLLLNFLAVQCALNSLGDVITLLRLSLGAPRSAYSTGLSDAEALAKITHLPAILWSLLWIALAVMIMVRALQTSRHIRARQSATCEKDGFASNDL